MGYLRASTIPRIDYDCQYFAPMQAHCVRWAVVARRYRNVCSMTEFSQRTMPTEIVSNHACVYCSSLGIVDVVLEVNDISPPGKGVSFGSFLDAAVSPHALSRNRSYDAAIHSLPQPNLDTGCNNLILIYSRSVRMDFEQSVTQSLSTDGTLVLKSAGKVTFYFSEVTVGTQWGAIPRMRRQLIITAV